MTTRKPGPKSKFTVDQDAYIESLYPALWVEYNVRDTASLTQWKHEKIDTIIASPLFVGKLPTEAENPDRGATHSVWKQRLLKKFNTDINKRRKQAAESHSTFLKFSSLTGYSLFGMEERTVIEAAAVEKAASTNTRMLDCIQSCQKQMWHALEDDKQAEYDRRAQETTPCVATNQVDFPRAASKALNDICRGGLVGRMELLLFWACRSEDGNLQYGVIDAHAADDVPNMADETEDWEASFDSKWKGFVDNVIPRPGAALPALESPVIPRNASGIPIFPDMTVVMNKFSIVEILRCYLTRLWQHGRSAASDVDPPWAKIEENCDLYYDTSRFLLPSPLKNPATTSWTEAFALATYFAGNATLNSYDPFVFRPEVSDRSKSPEGSLNLGSNNEDESGIGGTAGLAGKSTHTSEQSLMLEKATEEDSTSRKRKGTYGKLESNKRCALGTTTEGASAARKKKDPPASSTPKPPLPKKNRIHLSAGSSAPTRQQPKREKPALPRPAPPSNNQRPGWDIALVDAHDNFVAWADDAGPS
ncbi:hypothetical protein C8R43DRAFT_1130781 [Mycena crocata]|nr:hypothetical protein C8R43DRAFT_1130781 [Mycena crocata]